METSDKVAIGFLLFLIIYLIVAVFVSDYANLHGQEDERM